MHFLKSQTCSLCVINEIVNSHIIIKWYTDQESDGDRNCKVFIDPPQHVHLTLRATFHSLSLLNVRESMYEKQKKNHQVGVAQCIKRSQLEIAKKTHRECQ